MEIINASKKQSDSLEREAFWKEHIAEFHKTKLSRKAYCRAPHLNYQHFQYRYRKFVLPQNKQVLKAIPVRVNMISSTNKSPASLCTLELNSGRQLRVHDAAVLPALLERLL